MKKTLFTVLLVISVIFTSCGKEESAEEYISSFNEEYTANLSIEEKGASYTVRVLRDEDGTLDMVFAEPSVLWGMGYSFENDDSFLIYNDMSIELNANELPTSSEGGVYRWRELLKCAGEYTVGNDSLNGKKVIKLSNGECEIFFDKETASPLILKSGDTVITFDEWNGKNSDAETKDVSTN